MCTWLVEDMQAGLMLAEVLFMLEDMEVEHMVVEEIVVPVVSQQAVATQAVGRVTKNKQAFPMWEAAEDHTVRRQNISMLEQGVVRWSM